MTDETLADAATIAAIREGDRQRYRELVERYGQTTGRDTSNMLFCYVCGLFKVAVIAQQIYARYVRGLTQDPRFAGFNQMVAALGLGAVRAIDTRRF